MKYPDFADEQYIDNLRFCGQRSEGVKITHFGDVLNGGPQKTTPIIRRAAMLTNATPILSLRWPCGVYLHF